MKGQIRGKDQPNSQESGSAMAQGHAHGPAAGPIASSIDDALLRDYLIDALTPAASARVEKRCASRQSFELASKTSARIAPTASFTPWARFGAGHDSRVPTAKNWEVSCSMRSRPTWLPI